MQKDFTNYKALCKCSFMKNCSFMTTAINKILSLCGKVIHTVLFHKYKFFVNENIFEKLVFELLILYFSP